MQRFFEHSAAALAAIAIVTVSFSQVITVPVAQAAPIIASAPLA